MPKKELYESKIPHETPEPHAKPGYTGYFPDSGPRRTFQMAKIYERMTHDLMVPHPVAGLRFGFILDTEEGLRKKLEDEAMAWKHEHTAQNVKLRSDMVVGYTGYVPRKRFLCGKSYSEECKTATALMEKLKLVDG